MRTHLIRLHLQVRRPAVFWTHEADQNPPRSTWATSAQKLTQTCSCCGAKPDSRPKGIAGLGIREWTCSECGVTHDRDVNAARNILAAGRGRPVVGISVI